MRGPGGREGEKAWHQTACNDDERCRAVGGGGGGGGGGLHLVTEQEGKEGLVLVDWKDFSEEISKI